MARHSTAGADSGTTLCPPRTGRSKTARSGNSRAARVLGGNHGEQWLNSRKVVEVELGTPLTDSLLARSKYRNIKGFADKRAGHIVLQDHVDEVYFRSIKIRSL